MKRISELRDWRSGTRTSSRPRNDAKAPDFAQAWYRALKRMKGRGKAPSQALPPL
jgi:hypothetical protein